jgi:hypothetical protein
LVESRCSVFGQRERDFMTKTPLPPGEILIIGFMGGRDRWNDDRRAVRKLALKLRAMNLNRVYMETVENKQRQLGIRFIQQAFDYNRDGQLDEQERNAARLILYGQSFGGAAVVKAARELHKLGVPILLTVQIDSVGVGDALIPSNVASAANLFQRNGWIIRGEPQIRPEDSTRTHILGNFEFDYRQKHIDLSNVSWFKKMARVAHTKMEHDPDVWVKVEALIVQAIQAANPRE